MVFNLQLHQFYNEIWSSLQQWEVMAYSTAEEYDLKKLMQGLQQQALYHPSSMSEGLSHLFMINTRNIIIPSSYFNRYPRCSSCFCALPSGSWTKGDILFQRRICCLLECLGIGTQKCLEVSQGLWRWKLWQGDCCWRKWENGLCLHWSIVSVR